MIEFVAQHSIILQTKSFNHSLMAGVVQFIKESYDEMVQKVTWPTWAELQNSAVLVLVASIIIALIIFGMDKGAEYLLETFYNSLSN